MKRKAFVSLIAIWILPLMVRANPPEANEWNRHWNECYDFKLPIFQVRSADIRALLRKGMIWENQVKKELLALDEIMEVTCKKWAENPNGDAPLQEFIKKYSIVSTSALTLQEQAKNDLTPKLEGWWKMETAELAPFGFKFEEFPCGRAFLKTKKRVQTNLQSIEKKFQLLEKKCPAAANGAIAEAKLFRARSSSYDKGNGGPTRLPSSEHIKNESDITGTKPESPGGVLP